MRRHLDSRPTPALYAILVSACLLLGGCALPGGVPVTPHPVAVVLAGIKAEVLVHGDGQIDQVGSIADDPIRIQVREAASGNPVAQVPVDFLVFDDRARLLYEGRPEGAHQVLTDREGYATVHVRPPEKPARLTTRIQVRNPGTTEVVLEQRVLRYAVDPVLLLFRFLGGLAIFLFGMRLMTQALQAIAGDRLRRILETLTRHRLVGLASGAFITMFVQSSSATTVMTVGLVNAGLLTLNQAVPVMFGANIGTTITAQIIAFKISKYAFPMLFVGLLGTILGPSRRSRYAGEVIFGLAMLFLGMDLMGSVFKPLSTSSEFRSIFVGFSTTPLLGVLAGTLVTVLVQSSSATVGLTLILAEAGFVDFRGAFALILGDNIGTTITALLAAIPARTAARRTAVVHTLFNVAGAAIMLSLLYVSWRGQPIYLKLVDVLTPGEVFAAVPENIQRHVANSHAFFNVAFAILFLPASHLFAQLATRLIPGDGDEPQRTSHLAPSLLETPSVAMHSARLEMADMAALAREMFHRSMRGFFEGSQEDLDQVERDELEMDRRREEISNYLVGISEHPLETEDAERIPRYLHMVNDLERFGDLLDEVASLGRRRHDKELPFSEEALAELEELSQVLDGMVEAAESLLREADPEHAVTIQAAEMVVDRLEKRFRKAHIRRLNAGGCDLFAGIVFLDMLTLMEKQGDYLHNLAVALDRGD